MRLILPAGAPAPDLARLYAYPDVPWVRANMVTSVDGAAAVGGRSRGLSSDADRKLFALLRALSDVILVGAGTARAERYSAVRPDELRPGLRDGRPPVPPIAVVTRRLSLDLASPLFTAALPGCRTVVITTEEAPAELRASALRVADVIVAGLDSVDLAAALHALAERGYPHVVTEGGPQLLGQLADEELLDELCLTVSPLIVRGGSGRIMSGPGPGSAGLLDLRHLLEDDGCLFCRYTRKPAAIT
ncbi:MAG TPA: pyrimidine reductase family protein [Streptosporangiaceae bacterium]